MNIDDILYLKWIFYIYVYKYLCRYNGFVFFINWIILYIYLKKNYFNMNFKSLIFNICVL